MSNSTKADDENKKIRSLFDIQSVFCEIKTNDVIGFNNRKSAWRGQGGGVSSTNSLMMMENGDNEISIEVGSLGWFSEKKLTIEERRKYDPKATCKIDLVEFNGQNKKILSSMKVVVNKEGVPEVVQSNNHAIILRKIIAEQALPGHIDPDYFDAYYFPQGMELYKFSMKVHLTGIPKWSWVDAEPFDNSTEQIQKLKSAYNEMATIINGHDRARLKSYYSSALHIWSTTTGEAEDEILLSLFPEEKIEGAGMNIMPINWNDFSIRVMNKGRMIQMYNKSKPTYSPLTYYFINSNGNKAMNYYAPIFSLINGKFVPVI
ncbi:MULTISPECIES: hypothetical protein [Enterobacterales]|uniref:hypothetical protein n=1 Tax=Enterobacterales TaxID=91347 RepID=UPI002ED795FF